MWDVMGNDSVPKRPETSRNIPLVFWCVRARIVSAPKRPETPRNAQGGLSVLCACGKRFRPKTSRDVSKCPGRVVCVGCDGKRFRLKTPRNVPEHPARVLVCQGKTCIRPETPRNAPKRTGPFVGVVCMRKTIPSQNVPKRLETTRATCLCEM